MQKYIRLLDKHPPRTHTLIHILRTHTHVCQANFMPHLENLRTGKYAGVQTQKHPQCRVSHVEFQKDLSQQFPLPSAFPSSRPEQQ